MERSSSQRLASTSSQPPQAASKPAPQIDLFGDVPTPPARPSTTDTPNVRPPPPKAAATLAKPQKQGDSLLGLDFFGVPSSTSSARPSSATSTPGGTTAPSRPDLKQSILSLYSSAPRTQPQPQQESQDIFGGMQSPTPQQPSTSGGLDDAFSSLSFASTTSPPQTQPATNPDPFASFSRSSTQRSSFASQPIKSPQPLSGGGFFDTGTKTTMKPVTASKAPAQSTKPLKTPAASNGLGDFNFASDPAPITKQSINTTSTDLFDLSDPSPSQPTMPSKQPASNMNSAFNLSAPAPFSQPAAKSAPVAPTNSSAFSGLSNDDPWGSNDAWATPEPASVSKPKIESKSPPITTTNDFSSWGNPPITTSSSFGANSSFKETPRIAADEDFGGWNSAAPETPAAHKPPTQTNTKPPGGFGGSEDLFSNVWE
ncbi:ARF GAP with effector function(s), variant 2 [Xanthoria calcicola]